MHWFAGASASVSLQAIAWTTNTHKEPRANMPNKATFFFLSSWSLISSGTGRTIRTISSRMLQAAPPELIAERLRHWLGIARFQMDWIGVHWKMTRRRNMRLRVVRKIRKMLILRRKVLPVKTR